MRWLLDLFRCSHEKLSTPITLPAPPEALSDKPSETYVVCLDCGRKFPYSWEQMKIVTAPKPRRPTSSL
jgi:hypothetical protein